MYEDGLRQLAHAMEKFFDYPPGLARPASGPVDLQDRTV